MVGLYGEFQLFAVTFRAVREITVVSNRQQTLLEDIFEGMREVRGGLGKAVPPVNFLTKKMENKIKKL